MSTPPPRILTPAPHVGVFMTYQIHTGSDVMGNNQSNKLFEFSPVPFIQCDRTVDFSGKEQTGSTITINVSGTLIAGRHLTMPENADGGGIRAEPRPANMQYELGLEGMTPLMRLKRRMENILSVPGGEFRIYCRNADGNEMTYFRIYPQMIGTISFQPSPDNWVTTIPYTFQMVVHRTDLFHQERNNNGDLIGTPEPIYLESIDENWSIEHVDEKLYPSLFDFRFEQLGTFRCSKNDCANPTFAQAPGTCALCGSDLRKASSSHVMRLTHTLTATGKQVYGEQRFSTVVPPHRRTNETQTGTQTVQHNETFQEWKAREARQQIDHFQGGSHRDEEERFRQINHTFFTDPQDTNPQRKFKTPYQYAKQWIETRLKKTSEYVSRTPNLNSTHGGFDENNPNSSYFRRQVIGTGNWDDPNRPGFRGYIVGYDGYNFAGDEFQEPDFFYLDEDGIFNYRDRKRAFNHTRQKTGNETAGTYSVTESWLIISGDAVDEAALDEYTINCTSSASSGIETITIDGTITGFQEGNMFEPTQANQLHLLSRKERLDTKIQQANKLLNKLISNNVFYQRAKYQLELMFYLRALDLIAVHQLDLHQSADHPDIIIGWENLTETQRRRKAIAIARTQLDLVEPHLNVIPVSKSIRKQILEGIVTYSYEFNTRINNIFHDTISESFTTQITHPTDVFTNVVIPGRQRGPLFFSANTQQVPKYTLNYELVVIPLRSRIPAIVRFEKENDAPNVFSHPEYTGLVYEVDANGEPIDPPVRPTIRSNHEDAIAGIRSRVLPTIEARDNCRNRVKMVARVHYDYIKDSFGSEIRRIESDQETWDPKEGRYSGSLTFVFGPCKKQEDHTEDDDNDDNYLISLTKQYIKTDKDTQ